MAIHNYKRLQVYHHVWNVVLSYKVLVLSSISKICWAFCLASSPTLGSVIQIHYLSSGWFIIESELLSVAL
jgi:hypothetical protein